MALQDDELACWKTFRQVAVILAVSSCANYFCRCVSCGKLSTTNTFIVSFLSISDESSLHTNKGPCSLPTKTATCEEAS